MSGNIFLFYTYVSYIQTIDTDVVSYKGMNSK